MYNFIERISSFRRKLQANPYIKMLWDHFPGYATADLAESEIADEAQFLFKKYGGPYPFPVEDRQLVALPFSLNIAWESAPSTPLPTGIRLLAGCLNLANVAASISEPSFHSHLESPFLLETTPLLRHATLFDGGSAADVTKHWTYFLYDRAQRTYQGLVLLYGLRLIPLPLSMGDYVRAALAWHGAWGWQFLYLPLEEFRALDESTLLTLYDLQAGLPALFPDADWTVIADKQEYFAIAQMNKRR